MTETETIILTDEDGEEHEFMVVEVLEVSDKQYVVLLPLEEEKEDEEAVVLRLDVDENGEDVLSEIEDDAEWKAVEKAWQEL